MQTRIHLSFYSILPIERNLATYYLSINRKSSGFLLSSSAQVTGGNSLSLERPAAETHCDRNTHTYMNLANTTVILAERPGATDGSLKPALEIRGMQIQTCFDRIEAVKLAFSSSPDIIILDVNLAKLNGYLCARILKNEPTLSATPIIHINPSDSSIERYWSTTCGADGYVKIPVDDTGLDDLLNGLLRQGGSKRRLLNPVRVTADLDDHAIFNLATGLLEQDLLRSSILNEINMMDTSSMPTKDFITAMMAIVGSLFDFSLGIGMLLSETYGELFLYFSGKMVQAHFE